MILEICKNKNPILRKRAEAVTEISSKEIKLLNAMLDIMYKEKGVGLAAPQVGILKKLIVVDAGSGPLCLINPRFIKKRGKKIARDEGCLSLPKIIVSVKRYSSVIVEALDVSGKSVKIDASDMLARVIQHEMDHLQGKLIIDYLPLYKRLAVNIKIPSIKRSAC